MMTNQQLTIFFAIICAAAVNAFSFSAFRSSRTNSVQQQVTSSTPIFRRRSYSIFAKSDLFSDDLFEEDDDPLAPTEKKGSPDDASEGSPKRKYLEKKWKLAAEDEKEFTGFPGSEEKAKSDARRIPPADGKPVEQFPCFALMFKLKKEYMEAPIDSMLADHNQHCLQFKRFLNSEVINMGTAKGIVVLWAGLSADEKEKEETRSEITQFLEDEPFLAKDAIEKWDLIDLQRKKEKKEEGAAASPAAALPVS